MTWCCPGRIWPTGDVSIQSKADLLTSLNQHPSNTQRAHAQLAHAQLARSGPHPYVKAYSRDSVSFYLGTWEAGADDIRIVSDGCDQADCDGDGDVRDFDSMVKNIHQWAMSRRRQVSIVAR